MPLRTVCDDGNQLLIAACRGQYRCSHCGQNECHASARMFTTTSALGPSEHPMHRPLAAWRRPSVRVSVRAACSRSGAHIRVLDEPHGDGHSGHCQPRGRHRAGMFRTRRRGEEEGDEQHQAEPLQCATDALVRRLSGSRWRAPRAQTLPPMTTASPNPRRRTLKSSVRRPTECGFVATSRALSAHFYLSLYLRMHTVSARRTARKTSVCLIQTTSRI